MAWHILHGLLEQVRLQATFPGKIWIVVMFVFRIVVVARIGEDVYHDEQSSFICNTLTPGCTNVCFNRFSPISQLRYWSLMVLILATPSIFFFLYAMHEVHHAAIKFPYKETKKNNEKLTSQRQNNLDSIYLPKRKRESISEIKAANAAPLYVVTKMPESKKSKKLGKFLRKRRHTSRDDDAIMKKSISDNNAEELIFPDGHKCQIYSETHCRHIEFMRGENQVSNAEQKEQIKERKYRTKMMQHPELARAYWWHVVFRTALEVGSLLGQYYLYGLTVPELYECAFWPCPKSVDCFVSRPQEKTCLLWLMYGLGAFACVLSIAEFWTLGPGKVKNAFVCCTNESYEDRKKRLAMLEVQHSAKSPRGGATHEPHGPHVAGALSIESISSDTTVESV